jgi:hypothetical protein
MPGGHKRTVHVNVSPASEGGEAGAAEWWDDAGLAADQWATRTHSALMQPARPPRRLPALPVKQTASEELASDNALVHPLAPAESVAIVRETNC